MSTIRRAPRLTIPSSIEVRVSAGDAARGTGAAPMSQSRGFRRPGGWWRSIRVGAAELVLTDREYATLREALARFCDQPRSSSLTLDARALLHFWATGKIPNDGDLHRAAWRRAELANELRESSATSPASSSDADDDVAFWR
jgi:hypothetical protein